MKERLEKERQPALKLPKEMGFQSYELLAGDGKYRNAEKKKFLAGKQRNPALDYPRIDVRLLENSIRNLEPVLDMAQEYEDEMLGAVVWNSASYRMAEMYWLLEAKRLNELAEINPDSDAFRASAARYQEVNEQLYGRPEMETSEAVYGEILAQAQAKNLPPLAKLLYDDLVYGTVVHLDGEDVDLPGIGDHHPDRLPENVKDSLQELRAVLLEQFSDVIDIVQEYWEHEVVPRGDKKPAFEIEDMKRLFEKVRDFYDPENEAGISIVIDPNSSQLAWDTPTMSVVIGGKRRSIDDPMKMVSKIIHEYGVHGLRAVNGKKADIPAFNTGMYSDADEGERTDYLTFEEGFASLCEMAIDENFSRWRAMHISRYMVVAAAYDGLDFRQAFERTWRARVLMEVEDGGKVTDDIMDDARKEAFISCVRVYRGTPSAMVDRPLMTFNKDLAYLNGKLDALRYLNAHKGDKQAIMRLFLGKYDPNNHIQNSIVERYVET